MVKDTVDHINTIVKPEVYLSMFYFFNNPRSSILDNYLILLCVIYCVTGIAYALAIYFEPGQAQLWLVLLPVVLTLVASKESAVTAIVGDYIYSKWALEAFILANAKRYSGVWLIMRCGVLRKKGYALDHWYPPCLLKLILLGAASRCVAFLFLITFQKKLDFIVAVLLHHLVYKEKCQLQSQYHDESVDKPQKVGSLAKIIAYNLDMILAKM